MNSTTTKIQYCKLILASILKYLTSESVTSRIGCVANQSKMSRGNKCGAYRIIAKRWYWWRTSPSSLQHIDKWSIMWLMVIPYLVTTTNRQHLLQNSRKRFKFVNALNEKLHFFTITCNLCLNKLYIWWKKKCWKIE